ncbi:hypothetical protein [Sulfuriroseicoccus oceanibius]|uniref:Uncharacterized protein n=1 Tax=Sulfuriroseicoccus oceanibius TaxID=2707525 RepID=A0A6B3L4K2_9BACT|nr:hypothetical protein [Sulfuriroseicoccus oceanibius]QQL43729.1 hypothetical protein G3M56_007395 [Sulfuriroseicoccus oceanibius]
MRLFKPVLGGAFVILFFIIMAVMGGYFHMVSHVVCNPIFLMPVAVVLLAFGIPLFLKRCIYRLTVTIHINGLVEVEERSFGGREYNFDRAASICVRRSAWQGRAPWIEVSGGIVFGKMLSELQLEKVVEMIKQEAQ